MTQNNHTNDYQEFREKTNRQYAADQMARNFFNWLRDAVKYLNNLWLGPLYRRLIKRAPTPFLVVCHSRTGSNFLLWLLTSHPRILHIGEPFGSYQLEYPWVMERIRAIGTVGYLKERLQRKGNENAVAFKLLYEHLKPDFAKKWDLADMENLGKFVRDSADLKVIHLKRRNRLENLISHRIAEVTKTYILFNPNRRVNDIQIELTPQECEAEFFRVAALEQHYTDMFAHHPMVEVFYETLVADTQNEGRRILSFLGLKPRRLQEQTVKQNVRSVQDVVRNYEALQAHFRGTRWESEFSA
jgi:LPS sulfotransferase NodH